MYTSKHSLSLLVVWKLPFQHLSLRSRQWGIARPVRSVPADTAILKTGRYANAVVAPLPTKLLMSEKLALRRKEVFDPGLYWYGFRGLDPINFVQSVDCEWASPFWRIRDAAFFHRHLSRCRSDLRFRGARRRK
jgi:hypothetical protein